MGTPRRDGAGADFAISIRKEMPMDAIELLKSHHDEVKELFERIEDYDDGDERADLFAILADLLAAHAKIEETIFYPAVMSPDTRELLLEASEEHLAAKRVLADLIENQLDDEHFDAKIKVAKDMVLHHIEEEEGELFPQVRSLFDGDRLETLGAEMLNIFSELMESEPRRMVSVETDAPARL
jgi:hemerythrin superfamily protein